MIYLDVQSAVRVPVNVMPLTDDTDFKTRETAIAHNESGMDLVWNFITTAGSYSQTAVTPTTGGGDYDWTHEGDGMYTIGIPSSGGASIDNDTTGYGWFSGVCDGVLPWRGPTIGFRSSGTNNLLIDSAFSSFRGLAGNALPNATAGGNGGLPTVDGNNRIVGVQGTINTFDGLNNLSASGVQSAMTSQGYTTTRAGYLDNLNVGGNVASSAEVTAIQNTTRSKAVHPYAIERPDSGSKTVKLRLYLYDSAGNMEDADSTPSLAIENDAGTDRSGNLSAVSNTGTGEYEADYTVADDHAVENLRLIWTYVEGGNTIKVPGAIVVVDTTAVDFTSADRTKLDSILEDTGEIGSAGAGLTEAGGTGDQFTGIPKTGYKLAADGLDGLTMPANIITATSIANAAFTDAKFANIYAKAGDAMTLADSEDIYQAQIRLNVDEANTKNEWSAFFLKNGQPVTSGVTSVTIQVVKRTDGTDLIASTSMTEIGSTGVFKKDEATNRVTAGEDVVAIVSATIDSGSRTFRWILGRDSSA